MRYLILTIALTACQTTQPAAEKAYSKATLDRYMAECRAAGPGEWECAVMLETLRSAVK